MPHRNAFPIKGRSNPLESVQSSMLHQKCWTLLLLPLCLAFYRQERAARCGVPAAYGGQSIQASILYEELTTGSFATVKPPLPGFQERAARCDDVVAYGGQSIQAYLDNKSDKLVLPWTVAIRNNLGKFKCLGSIIPDIDHSAMQRNSSALVLTAGSCFRHSLRKKWGTPRHYKVYAGLDRLHLFLNRGEKSRARAIRIMPYNAVNENIWNGVAVVTLKKPFVFNKHISPVCLAGEHESTPDTSFCFVSTYHKRRLDEEVVRMVPGSPDQFGHFPELARTGGLCSHHERADTEKSLGGPLVCMVNGIAYQFGVYLSQLITRKALSFHKQALHFYGHVTTALEKDPLTASNVIQLGSTGAHSKSSESSSSSASKPQQGCAHPPPPPEVVSASMRTTSSIEFSQIFYVFSSLRKKWGTPRHYKVYAGLDRLHLFLNRGEKSRARAIRIMPYNAVNENIWNGVAVVTLKKPFVFNKHISPVCLAGEHSVPPDTSFCFVSTYHKRRLDEEVVRMVPGSVCRFGHFPELARTGGLCSHHERADTEKSLGGPLVCMVNGIAYQFGVYLSQLITRKALSFHKQALHFYGHVTTALEKDPLTASNVIQLGSTGAHSKSSESSSSSASKPQQGCAHPPPPPPQPVYCGDTITFGRTLQSYVVGNNAQDMFPWNVIITTRVRGSTRCVGSLVHKGHERQAANSSDVVLTAADCFNGRKHRRLRVYAGSPRFSRLRRRGAKVKIANVLLYGLPWENKRIRPGVAILKLERPLLRKDNVVPVCLAQRESVPPPYASCYVTHYDKHEHRIDEEIVMVTRNARCLAAQGSNAPQFRGICAVEEKKKHYIQLGSPMVCIVHGRAYQYGVYLNQLSLKINDKVKQNLGFYSEISIVHDVFAGRNVPTLPDRAHLHPGSKPHKPVRASSSSSSSGSHEFYKRPIGHVPNVRPTLPTKPLPLPRPGRRRSMSSSASDSSSDSSSKGGSTSHEQADTSRSSEESDESSRVLKLNVRVPKPRLERWTHKDKRRPVIRSHSSSSSSSEIVRPHPLPSRPTRPVICPIPGQRPIRPIPDSTPSNGILICPMPGNGIQVVPLPTPLPTAEYPSSSIEAVGMVILPSLPKYDLSNRTIATHEHILVRDNVIGESAIAKGSSASCATLSINGELNSLLPVTSSGEITGNEIPGTVPDVYGKLVTQACTTGGSAGHSHHHSSQLPGASGVHIFKVSGSSIEALCTGTLYVKHGQMYSDEVVTASRCVQAMAADKYRVYVGSLLPRQMTVDQLGKTLIEVASIFATPLYAQYSELKAMGMTVLKLKHRVKVAHGVESFPLPYSSTSAASGMPCYVSGVCEHGMPVRTQYQLLTPTQCAQHLGEKYLPNVMYCGIGQKEILQHPVGSPLLCQSSGTWTQFGIYDHSVRKAVSYSAGRSVKQEQSEIALFMKLEDDDVARIQTLQTNSI
ncbi:hypothetical protein M514_00541 [Trichuris suis]|uniref:Peptidase S1 domain-containing protein n=1 Tax=Trichuris suis TaxID=68888 RepID=A0A085NDC8_9BILA|nr:hypothetical protein M514_00541 [Trichuris suis]